MIVGTGIDIVEIERIEKVMKRQQKFIDRILTENEQKKFYSLTDKRKTEFLAGRFAAKEAYSKAIGTGIGKDLSFLDIEITSDDKGKPCITKPNRFRPHLSITHSKEYAFAQVLLEDI